MTTPSPPSSRLPSQWRIDAHGDLAIDESAGGTGGGVLILTAGDVDNTLLIANMSTGNTIFIVGSDGTIELRDKNNHAVIVTEPGVASGKVGFYGHATTTQQTGVAVTAAGIHAALVALGLITA